MLPLLLGAGALLQGGLGFLKARSQKKQAEAQEQQNRAANVMDQAWSGLLGQKAQRQEEFEKPSVLGSALQGGLGGAMQGMNVYQGMEALNAKKKMMEKLQGKDLEAALEE